MLSNLLIPGLMPNCWKDACIKGQRQSPGDAEKQEVSSVLLFIHHSTHVTTHLNESHNKRGDQSGAVRANMLVATADCGLVRKQKLTMPFMECLNVLRSTDADYLTDCYVCKWSVR